MRTGPVEGSTGSLAGMSVVMPLRFRHGDRGIGTVRFCSRHMTGMHPQCVVRQLVHRYILRAPARLVGERCTAVQ
jgi:hypothetical protein